MIASFDACPGDGRRSDGPEREQIVAITLKFCGQRADRVGAEPGIDAPGSCDSESGVRRSA